MAETAKLVIHLNFTDFKRVMVGSDDYEITKNYGKAGEVDDASAASFFEKL